MKSQQLTHWIILLTVLAFTLQCGGSVQRISSSQVKDLSGRWNDTDARLVAEEMTKDIVQKPWMAEFIKTYQRQPVLVVGEIVNRSHEHIESDPFIKDIERDLLNAGSIRIITHGSFREKLRSQRQDQQQNTSSTEVQKKAGRELGADFILFGSINAIVDSKKEGSQRVIFYQVSLELADLETNEIVWIGDKKIKKYVKK
jgi:penicillin-binding protein activator